jgi:NADPH:quinone reductase-like Zn-dependent oxidoreductase
MSTMSAIRMHEFGPPEVLMLETLDRPEPGTNEVLVKVLAASVNPVDWKIRQGGYPAVKKKTFRSSLAGIWQARSLPLVTASPI